jgi:RNA polymerase sigma-70 factor (ECF subfamily)
VGRVDKRHLTGDFAAATEPFRRELFAHCYRMLGSIDDAEDAVQETYLRAWRAYDRFEGRSSVRVWLYRIATNVCLTALEGRGRRFLPSTFGPPDAAPAEGVAWLQPIPDDPADVATARESVRLAFVASLQFLPGRQRAALLLREVLDWSAREVAEALDTTVPAVKSMLQRARAQLRDKAPDAEEPTATEAREILDRYVEAFETADVAALEKLLRDDATLEVPPSSAWFRGKAGCVPVLADAVGAPGDWRMEPVGANGQPAAVAYFQGEPFGVAVLDVASGGLRGIVAFADPGLVARFTEQPFAEQPFAEPPFAEQPFAEPSFAEPPFTPRRR